MECGARFATFNGPGGVQSIINANLHQTDIGIRRDTAAVEYRWTPTDAWDIKADYSHMHREGTQAMGVVFNNSSSRHYRGGAGACERHDAEFRRQRRIRRHFAVGQEVQCQTGVQRFGLSERHFVRHRQSVLQTRRIQAEAIQPFADVCNTADCIPRIWPVSLYPDNNANAVSGTVGADLPWQSRYMGTVSYTMMRQNDAFLPFTTNALLNPPGRILINGQPATSLAALPAFELER